MSGTKEGGEKAAKTNKERHGADFFARIGAKGGRNGRGPGYKAGFAISHEWAVECGKKGGKVSKRGPAKKNKKVEDAKWYKRVLKLHH